MFPELFRIPFTQQTVKSYGTLVVLGFLAAVGLMRWLARRQRLDAELLTNAALYGLIAGLVGARLFYVIHHFEQYRGHLLEMLAVWRGGLEFLGGFVGAVVFLWVYLRRRRVTVLRYLDVLAVGLMGGMIFGRVGCFLNGCCYGRPTDVPWAVRFPYGSIPYYAQVEPDPARDRSTPYVTLPRSEYFEVVDGREVLKPWDRLTPAQRQAVTTGPYRPKAIHPTQLYASLMALIVTIALLGFQMLKERADFQGRWWSRPGTTCVLMLYLYGLGRFGLEALRDDNPFEWAGLTISQLICLAMVGLAVAWTFWYLLSRDAGGDRG